MLPAAWTLCFHAYLLLHSEILDTANNYLFSSVTGLATSISHQNCEMRIVCSMIWTWEFN